MLALLQNLVSVVEGVMISQVLAVAVVAGLRTAAPSPAAIPAVAGAAVLLPAAASVQDDLSAAPAVVLRCHLTRLAPERLTVPDFRIEFSMWTQRAELVGFTVAGGEERRLVHIEDLSKAHAVFSWTISGFDRRTFSLGGYDTVSYRATYNIASHRLTLIAFPNSNWDNRAALKQADGTCQPWR
jgi:hypothetical protein